MELNAKDTEEIILAIRQAIAERCAAVSCGKCKRVPPLTPTAFVMDAGVFQGEGRCVYSMSWRSVESGWAFVEVDGKHSHICPACIKSLSLERVLAQ